MADSRNFLLNTDYPMDKVVYMTSGSFTSPTGGIDYQFSHNLSFNPLIIGTWSLDSDFSTSREGGFFGFEGTDPTTVYAIFSADSTNITIRTINPGASVVVYYRIYAFMPTNVNDDSTSTASIADNFVLNTDYNYTKLFLSGVSVAVASTVVTHNLGYRPQVIAWLKDSTIYGTELIVDMGYIKVTDTTIEIVSPTYDVHYRIYADGQL